MKSQLDHTCRLDGDGHVPDGFCAIWDKKPSRAGISIGSTIDFLQRSTIQSLIVVLSFLVATNGSWPSPGIVDARKRVRRPARSRQGSGSPVLSDA